MYAAYISHDTVVNLLLEAGADANKGTLDGLMPLMVAAGCGNESICYFLLQASFTVCMGCSTHALTCVSVVSKEACG